METKLATDAGAVIEVFVKVYVKNPADRNQKSKIFSLPLEHKEIDLSRQLDRVLCRRKDNSV